MRNKKPVLSRYDKYLADKRRADRRQMEWDIQPMLIGNDFDEGNGTGLEFDWNLDAFGRHAAYPYRGWLCAYVHWPANPTIVWLSTRYSPDIVGKKGGLILSYSNGRATDIYEAKLAAEASYHDLMSRPELCPICRGKCWEIGVCPGVQR